MIQIAFDSARIVDWALATALGILLVVQVVLTLRSPGLSAGRKAARLALNVVVWLLLAGFVFDATWQTAGRPTRALLVGAEVPTAVANRVADSLRIRTRLSTETLRSGAVGSNPATLPDTVWVLGQDVAAAQVAHLSRTTLRWLPYAPGNQPEALRWRAILRLGEWQRVDGTITVSEPQTLSLRYGGQTLDSVRLMAGRRAFRLGFPAFARGRTAVELALGGQVLDTLRFFARPAEPLAYQFLLDNPDFEFKTLADWLGKQGQRVSLTARLTTGLATRTDLNVAPSLSRPGATLPDVIITDPANATNPAVKRAVAAGKSVLFLGVANPEADVLRINRALGTTFGLRRIANETTVPVGLDLTAGPFRLVERPGQLVPQQLPFTNAPAGRNLLAVAQTDGRVGVSLLNETFPLQLRGDSLLYARLWSALLAPLHPARPLNVDVAAPVLAGQFTDFSVDNVAKPPAVAHLDGDTVALRSSPVNAGRAGGQFRFRRAGWRPVFDSLWVYVAGPNEFQALAQRQTLTAHALAHRQAPARLRSTENRTEHRLPDWAWLVLLVAGLTALWLEPKVGR